MKRHRALAPTLAGLIICVALDALARAQQPPSLVAQAGRTVHAARGSDARSFQIDSSILKETRRILVVLPASYSESAADRRYPVTVVADGEYLIGPVVAVSDELARNGQIPESVIVGIENVPDASIESSNVKRVHDFTPPGLSVSGSTENEGGDAFLDFIEKELLPALDREFRTAAPRAFVGVSSGGILATYAAATRATYVAVVSLDAPIDLGDNWLAKKLTARAKATGPPVRYASIEAKFGWPDDAWKSLVASAPASWKLFRERCWPRESHESINMIGAYLGLREVLSDYSMHAAPPIATSILPYYAKLSASLGAAVLPPKKLLEQTVDDLLAEGRGAAAREAYEKLAFGYGKPSDSTDLLARITETERRPAPTETIEGLVATPFSTPEEARDVLGDWVGDILMKPEQPRDDDTTLRIEVMDGKVVGKTVHHVPDGTERVAPWVYFQITPQGMTWGTLNGMRPRGVVLFEGTLEGDFLSGRSRMGGTDFRQTDGSPPPALYFSFKRARKK